MDEELDLIELLYEYWKKRLWLILALVLGVLLGFAYTKFIVTPKYTSSATLLLAKSYSDATDSASAITQSDIALNQKLISTYGEIMKSKTVSNSVIQNLNLDMTYEALKKGISVSSVKDTDVIKLSITTTAPELSTQIANEMTKVFIKEVEKKYKINNISVLDAAEDNDTPVNVKYTKNMALFAFAFMAITAAAIFLAYYFDNTIKTEENITKLTGLPVLCTIPKLNTKKGGK